MTLGYSREGIREKQCCGILKMKFGGNLFNAAKVLVSDWELEHDPRFGKTGQVATELQDFEFVKALGREQADLSDPEACARAVKFYRPQAVTNAAAYTAVDKAESEEDLANIINGDATGAIANACSELNIPLVHISTDYVFDGTGTKPWSITDIPNPRNAYGRSKLKGEEIIKASGCTYAILRTSWVVSAHGRFCKKDASIV